MGWGIFYYILFIFHILPVSLLSLKLNGKELTRTIFFLFVFWLGSSVRWVFSFHLFRSSSVDWTWLLLKGRCLLTTMVSFRWRLILGFVSWQLASTFCFQFFDNQEKLVLIPEMMQSLFGCSLFHNQWSIGPLNLEQNLFKFFRHVCLYGVVF